MNMREKIARALFDGRNRFIMAFDGKTYDELNEESRAILLAVADAALDAMREPTEKMVGAGAREHREGKAPRNVFVEMIDAAKEGK